MEASAPLAAEFNLPHRPTYNRVGAARWIFSHALRYWPYLISMTFGALTNAAMAALVPVLIGQAFNAILASPPRTGALLGIALLIGGSQLVRGVLQLARNFSAELLAQGIERDIRDEIYISLLGKSMTFHSLQPVGDTMARATNDVREINYMFSPGINLVIGSANFMIMPLILAPRYHPSLILVPAIFIIAYFLALWQYLRELEPITTEVRAAFGEMNTRLAEAIDGIETVKGMAQEQNEVNLFDHNARRFRNAAVRQGFVEARFLPMLFLGIVQAAGLLHAILLYHQGLVQIGDIVTYFGLLQLFGFPTFVSLFAYSQLSLGLAGGRRILELINRENDLDQNVRGNNGPMRGEVEFRDVRFAYSGGAPVLENISFSVQPGQTVAIVGQTGTGKTSLVKLINRTYDASGGQVLVDGMDVRSWNLEALRRNISIIEQDIFLFSHSIADNISFGKPGATIEEIRSAADAAQAQEFIATFQEGYDTVIGERGVTLSGGQRQRLALARAFLTDPRILVLDDSTSSIDSATEDKIQRAIYAAARGRTTFIITHRLSQIRWADLILVLRKGRLAAVGSHDELMKTSGIYRRIFTEERDRGAEPGD
ncbi:MAG: ABC transporter ATP-binding protein [Omnitrophica WOR_2 bacterium]